MEHTEELVPATAAIKFEKIEIMTDGTGAGTTIMVNGKEIKDLSEFCLSFYDYGYGGRVSASYCTREKNVKPGNISESHRYVLNPPPEPSVVPGSATVKAEASISETPVNDVTAGDQTFDLTASRFNVFN